MYIVAYDIADDRERRRINRVLDGYGRNVQRSVYLCRVRGNTARRMLTALRTTELQSGFVLCWSVPDSVVPECIGERPRNLALEPERVFII